MIASINPNKDVEAFLEEDEIARLERENVMGSLFKLPTFEQEKGVYIKVDNRKSTEKDSAGLRVVENSYEGSISVGVYISVPFYR